VEEPVVTVEVDEEYNDGWRPRHLPGGVYCSPRCGGSCKLSDYERAVNGSKALAERMGDGWRPEMWENLGWFWIVRRGNLEIHPCSDGTYSAWFQGSKQFIAYGDTPEDALANVIRDLRCFVETIQEELREVT